MNRATVACSSTGGGGANAGGGGGGGGGAPHEGRGGRGGGGTRDAADPGRGGTAGLFRCVGSNGLSFFSWLYHSTQKYHTFTFQTRPVV